MDGRHFPLGASMFGKNSARVVITGFRPDLPASALGGKPAPCTDLTVLGQVIQLARAQDGHPFLIRRTIKRGIIENICDTKIHFVQARKTYDFFADDGSAVILTEKDMGLKSIPDDSIDAHGSTPDGASQVAADEVELDENLTGRDLLQLTRTKAFRGATADSPPDTGFEDEDLKEGAYFMCRRRLRAALATDNGFPRVSAPNPSAVTVKQEISVVAGTLGRIEKSAGFRSEPLWVGEIFPDSVPLPFLRSLISLPRTLGGSREPALPRKVVLASSDLVEINQFLDQSGAEWTRLGEVSETSDVAEPGTMRLPMLYGRPALSLEENLALAERSGTLAAIQQLTRGLRLDFKNPASVAQRRTLVFEEGSLGDALPDLSRRQCFLGMERLASLQDTPAGNSTRPALFVTSADVKVFRPKDWPQVPPNYYAIDLELLLRPKFSSVQVPLVCRFPLASIDLALVDMMHRILSTRFEVYRGTSEVWRKD
jgi:hypothetical protein